MTEGDWIVPNRNMILLSLAINRAVLAGADTVTIGAMRMIPTHFQTAAHTSSQT
jgi:7-cyano-7-deazaguanine synthase in queuosine biosynthesis